MKTKLTSLALLMPAVVLAQSAPQAPAPQPPQNQLIPKTIEQNTLTNTAGINKAAVAARALSKARSEQSDVGGSYYLYTSKSNAREFCTTTNNQCNSIQSQ